MTDAEFFQVLSMTKQLEESTRLMNSTVSPQVFFGRLHFSLDVLLALVDYEFLDSSIFPEKLPSEEFNSLVEHLSETVDSFIDRALLAEKKKTEKLKTYKGQFNHFEKFMISLITAFDCADEYWPGNQLLPHFSGPLYTDENYQRVQQLYDQLDELYEPIVQAEIESIKSKHSIVPDDEDIDNADARIFSSNAPDFSGSFLHIAGLPLLIGTFCTVSHFSDHLYISSPRHRHTLSLDKILDVSIISYKDILTLYKRLLDSAASSPAFQALDETVRVSAKKKYLTAHTKFLVFSYSSSADAHSAIIFQLNDDNLRDAQKFVTGDHTYIRPKVEL